MYTPYIEPVSATRVVQRYLYLKEKDNCVALFMKPHYHVTVRAMIIFRFGRHQVRHDIGWFDKDESAVGILTNRLESEASLVRIQRTLSKHYLEYKEPSL